MEIQLVHNEYLQKLQIDPQILLENKPEQRD